MLKKIVKTFVYVFVAVLLLPVISLFTQRQEKLEIKRLDIVSAITGLKVASADDPGGDAGGDAGDCDAGDAGDCDAG